MRQHPIHAVHSCYASELHAWALFLLLIAACFSANPALAQRPSLHDGVLTLPYVISNETAYSVELSLITDSEPVRFELIASQPLALSNSLDSSSFVDNRLFVTDIDVDGLAYWAELALLESTAGAPTVFEVLDFGVHAAVVSNNLLGLDTQPLWQRLPGNASDIGVGADGSVWAIGTDERGGGFGIYHWLGSSWQRVDGGALRIDVGPDGIPWIVNNSHSIYRRQHGAWQRVGGNARDIGIGADGSVWVTSGGGTYLYDKGNWVGVRGSGVRIDVDPNGIPWVLDHTNDIHQLIAGRWVQRRGAARDIGIGGDGSVWIVGTSEDDGGHRIYRWSGTAWNRVSGSSRQISVGPDGYPWTANSGGDIYRSQ
jgi:hypothetical protein